MPDLSKCCSATAVVWSSGEGTSHYECTKCKQACDIYSDGCGDPDCNSCNKSEWWREEPFRIRKAYSDWFDIEKIIVEATRRRDEEIRGMIEAEKKVWTGLFDVPLKAPCDALDHILIHLRD